MNIGDIFANRLGDEYENVTDDGKDVRWCWKVSRREGLIPFLFFIKKIKNNAWLNIRSVVSYVYRKKLKEMI